MKNLKLRHSLCVSDVTELANTQQMCIDYNGGIVYLATLDKLLALDTTEQQLIHQVSLHDASCGSSSGDDDDDLLVVGMEHLSDQMSVCIAMAKGDVLLWSPDSGQVECVGCVDHGLSAMSWSSDQGLVILATGQNTLIMMTDQFEPVTEVPMFSDQFGEAEFVNVGWGKKETQFHGSEGKAAAFTKKYQKIGPVAQWDDRRPRISWHSDGEYFSLSAIEPDIGCRRLRVWTRDCRLYSTSELLDGLEQPLDWKSSGNLMTASQRRPNKLDIIFFEKNGLCHGEFTLPFDVCKVKVREVFWNRDSTILAIWLEDLKPDGSTEFVPHSYVQLWTVNNYHWYLKQNLEFLAHASHRVTAVRWDVQHSNTLHIICLGGRYLQYSWAWVTDTYHGKADEPMTITAVIDGDRVLMTPFHQMIIPPPMSAYKLCLPSSINQIAFAPPTSSSDMAVLMSNNQIALFKFDKEVRPSADPFVQLHSAGGSGFSIKCDLPAFHGMYSITNDPVGGCYPLKYYHLTWCRPEVVLLCALRITDSGTEIHKARVIHKKHVIEISQTTSVPGYVYNIAVSRQSGRVVLELTDGRVLLYDPDQCTVSPWLSSPDTKLVYSSSKLCTQMDVCTIGQQEVVIGLNDQYQLFINDIEVAGNCTSYAINEDFVLLTTFAHTCQFISRKIDISALSNASPDKWQVFDESVRRVERGSQIVAVVQGQTTLVLQMPRGNLETIHPRALVLSAVCRHLSRLEYRMAFILMRKHRINMNLIHDYNPDLFLDNVDKFIRQVETPAWISLFITDIQEDDVTQTMYPGMNTNSQTQTTPGEETRKSKVDLICDKLKQSLEDIDPDRYLLSILTAHVKKSNPELDVALKKIKDLKAGTVQRSVSAEEALKYLLFLVDVNEMYDVALGTYDFDLVLMVAERSQKDPREYIPYLNSLRIMEENYRKYTIDRHLHRYTSALHHLVKCEDHFHECLQLVKEQKLYREALVLYEPGSTEYKDIATAYGDYLLSKHHPDEAGLFYSKAEEWDMAVKAFIQANSWQLALCTAYKAKFDRNQLEQLARQLVSNLKEQSKHREAAIILEQHLDDLEEAIVTLIEGCHWEEALRLMYKNDRSDFIQTHFHAALLQSQSGLVALFTSHRQKFDKYKKRLAVVRAKKKQEHLEILDGVTDNKVADADLFSDTSSLAPDSIISSQTADTGRSTLFSRRSSRSAKGRRKQEKKKWSLKEGSLYEDMALLDALSKICKQVEDWKDEVASLLRMLTLFDHQVAAADLQKEYGSLHDLIVGSVEEIWPEDSDVTHHMHFGPESTANVIVEAVHQGRLTERTTKMERSLSIPPTLSKDNAWKLHSAVTLDN